MRLWICVILSLSLLWGCGDPPNSVMEMVLPDKDMPAAEAPPPVTTIADAKTPPAQVVPVTEKEEPPVTVAAEEPPPPTIEAEEMPDLSLAMEMEAIIASEGEVLSPIPDDVYEQLWGHWTEAGSLAPRKFYKKFIDADGIAIVGSENVEDMFFQMARHIVLVMTSKVTGLREALSADQPGGIAGDEVPFRVVLTHRASNDVVNMPEHLNTQLGHTKYWVGSFGGYFARADVGFLGRDPNGNIFGHPAIIHEMAHAIDHALTFHPQLLPNFRKRLDTAFDREMERVQLRTEVDGNPYLFSREELEALPEWEDRPSYCIVQGNAHANASEFWAIFVEDKWFDKTFDPTWGPERFADPDYDPFAYQRETCPNLLEILEEVFPPFSLHFAVETRDYRR